eukprot:511963-Amphidinium_carterae.1
MARLEADVRSGACTLVTTTDAAGNEQLDVYSLWGLTFNTPSLNYAVHQVEQVLAIMSIKVLEAISSTAKWT